MPETIRCFIGLSLNDAVKDHIKETIAQLKLLNAPVKWIQPETAHITLKFLGSTSPEQLNAVKNLLTAIASNNKPFSIKINKAGAFPSAQHPKIIWIGFEDPDSNCATVASQLEQKCESLGFAKENRPFKGHITIGRVKNSQRTQDLAHAISTLPSSELEQTVTSIHIYKSVLTSDGPIYKILETFNFKK